MTNGFWNGECTGHRLDRAHRPCRSAGAYRSDRTHGARWRTGTYGCDGAYRANRGHRPSGACWQFYRGCGSHGAHRPCRSQGRYRRYGSNRRERRYRANWSRRRERRYRSHGTYRARH